MFRASNGRTKTLIGGPQTSKQLCELVKRRLKDAELPLRLSPYSFRVTAFTDLLTKTCRSNMFNLWPGMRKRERPGFATGGK